ncbi:MAG: hypothetical protein ACOYNI_04585 [Acidimicrobiia bacterium]
MRPPAGKIGRDDIERKLRDIGDTVEGETEQARSLLPMITLVTVGVVIVGAYLIGKRRGKKRSAFIEIRSV